MHKHQMELFTESGVFAFLFPARVLSFSPQMWESAHGLVENIRRLQFRWMTQNTINAVSCFEFKWNAHSAYGMKVVTNFTYIQICCARKAEFKMYTLFDSCPQCIRSIMNKGNNAMCVCFFYLAASPFYTHPLIQRRGCLTRLFKWFARKESRNGKKSNQAECRITKLMQELFPETKSKE